MHFRLCEDKALPSNFSRKPKWQKKYSLSQLPDFGGCFRNSNYRVCCLGTTLLLKFGLRFTMSLENLFTFFQNFLQEIISVGERRLKEIWEGWVVSTRKHWKNSSCVNSLTNCYSFQSTAQAKIRMCRLSVGKVVQVAELDQRVLRVPRLQSWKQWE